MAGDGMLRRFDAGLVRVEKGAMAVLLLGMGLLVFLDVIHRVTTRPEGFLTSLAQGMVGASDGETPGVAAVRLGYGLWGLLAMGVATLAFRTRGQGWGGALARGVASACVLGASLFAFVHLVPNGIVWSQTLALALMLWLGFLGASVAARENRHLALDIGSKVWPKDKAHLVSALGNALTAGFCLFLLILSVVSVSHHYGDWQATSHAGGTLVGLPIPKWLAFLSLPYGWGVLAFRFSLIAWDAARGRVAAEESELDTAMRQLGIQPSASSGGEE